MTASFIVTYFEKDGSSHDEKIRAENGQEAAARAHESMPPTATGLEVHGLTRLVKYRRPVSAVREPLEQIS